MTISITSPQQIHGGWRVRETEHFYIDVLKMMFNTRLVITPKSSQLEYLRGWCYQEPLHATILRAGLFDPEAGEEPVGWVKEVNTERRACASYLRGARRHPTYEADCPDCGDENLRH